MADKKVTTKRERKRQYWQQQVSAWQHSGLSASVFAQQHQLCDAQLKRWYYRLKQEAKDVQQSAPHFLPLQVSASPAMLVITSQNGLQLQLQTNPLQQPYLLAFIKELLCGQ